MEFSKHGRVRLELQRGSITQSHSPHLFTSSDSDISTSSYSYELETIEATLCWISGDRVHLEIQKGDINSLQNFYNDTSSQDNYPNYELPTTDDSNKNVSSSTNIQQQPALPNEIKDEEAIAQDNSSENVITASAVQMQQQPAPNEIKEVEAGITQDNSNESSTTASGTLTYLRTRLNDAILCITSFITCARPCTIDCEPKVPEDTEIKATEAFGENVHLELQRGYINTLDKFSDTLSQYNTDDDPVTTNSSNKNVITTSAIVHRNTASDKIQNGNYINQVVTMNAEDRKIDIKTQDPNNQLQPSGDKPDQNQSHNASSSKESHEQTFKNATSNLHQVNAKTSSFVENTDRHDVQQDLKEACGAKHNHASQSSSFNKFTPTDAIINFVYEDDINGKDGILEAAGESVKEEYDVNRQKKDRVVRCGVVETGAGNLKPSQGIFHVTVFQHAAKFKTALHTALRVADRHGMRSVAVPALPSDSPTEKALIDSYLEVFYEFEEQENPRGESNVSALHRDC